MDIDLRGLDLGKKAQPFYLLYILNNYENKDEFGKAKRYFSQQDLVRILTEKYDFPTERKSVARDLNMLATLGYKIHGIGCPDIDKEEDLATRGKIWLENDISDEALALMVNEVRFNVYLSSFQKKEIIKKLANLGGKKFKKAHNANTLVDSGHVFQVEESDMLEQLGEIDKAISSEKRIKFKYCQAKFKNKVIYEVGDSEELEVSPYWLVIQNGSTYLVGYSHEKNKICHYRVDKIKNVKQLNTEVLPRRSTELNDISVGEYVKRHPLMFTTKAINVKIKISTKQLGDFVKSFGTNFTPVETKEDYFIIELLAGEDDMFYWSVQYGAEVLRPQSLRDKIRVHIESMAFNYKAKEGDKYSEAIKSAIRTKTLNLSGIDLSDKKEHYGLKTIKKVYLSNNNIDNVDFLKDYHWLQELQLENNDITDLSCLSNLRGLRKVTLRNLKLQNLDFVSDKYFSKLLLDLDETTNYSALLSIRNKDNLIFADRCAKYSSIPREELTNCKIKFVYEKDVSQKETLDDENKLTYKFAEPMIFEKFPFNFLYYAFGNWAIKPDKIIEVETAVDKVFDKFTNDEKRYLEARYKQRITDKKQLIENLVISEKEYNEITTEIEEKIKRSQICDELKEFFIEGALKGDFSEGVRVLNNIELMENLEKIEEIRKKEVEKILKNN